MYTSKHTHCRTSHLRLRSTGLLLLLAVTLWPPCCNAAFRRAPESSKTNEMDEERLAPDDDGDPPTDDQVIRNPGQDGPCDRMYSRRRRPTSLELSHYERDPTTSSPCPHPSWLHDVDYKHGGGSGNHFGQTGRELAGKWGDEHSLDKDYGYWYEWDEKNRGHKEDPKVPDDKDDAAGSGFRDVKRTILSWTVAVAVLLCI